VAGGDFRATAPRFVGENLERNLALVDALRAVTESTGATVAQIAIGWVLSRGKDVVPLVGARRRDRLAEALGALGVELSEVDLAAIERAVPRGAAAGDRHDARAGGRFLCERLGTEPSACASARVRWRPNRYRLPRSG
jgi:hypothetical protein